MKKNNSIVTNEFVVVNVSDVVMIKLSGDNEYVIFGKNNVELLQTAGFESNIYESHNFIKINQHTYINPTHIHTINTRYKTIQLTSGVSVDYEESNESQIISSLSDIQNFQINY